MLVVDPVWAGAPKLNPPPAAPNDGAGGLLWGVVEPDAGAEAVDGLPNENDAGAGAISLTRYEERQGERGQRRGFDGLMLGWD